MPQPRISDHLEKLRQLNLEVRRQLEVAEAVVPRINSAVEQLTAIELVSNTALLGEVVFDQSLTVGAGSSDASIVLQACLIVAPNAGVGVIAWDREEFLASRGPNGPSLETIRARFVKFDECASAIRGLLMPQLESLTRRLWMMARPAGWRTPQNRPDVGRNRPRA